MSNNVDPFERIRYKELDIIVESLIYTLIQKCVIENIEEFCDIVEATELAKKLT